MEDFAELDEVSSILRLVKFFNCLQTHSTTWLVATLNVSILSMSLNPNSNDSNENKTYHDFVSLKALVAILYLEADCWTRPTV